MLKKVTKTVGQTKTLKRENKRVFVMVDVTKTCIMCLAWGPSRISTMDSACDVSLVGQLYMYLADWLSMIQVGLHLGQRLTCAPG